MEAQIIDSIFVYDINQKDKIIGKLKGVNKKESIKKLRPYIKKMEKDDEFISLNEEKEEIIDKDIEDDFLLEDIIISEKGLFKIYIKKNELNNNKKKFDIFEPIQNEQIIKIQNNNFNNNINNFDQNILNPMINHNNININNNNFINPLINNINNKKNNENNLYGIDSFNNKMNKLNNFNNMNCMNDINDLNNFNNMNCMNCMNNLNFNMLNNMMNNMNFPNGLNENILLKNKESEQMKNLFPKYLKKYNVIFNLPCGITFCFIVYYYESMFELISSFCKKIGDSYEFLEYFYNEEKINYLYEQVDSFFKNEQNPIIIKLLVACKIILLN